MCAISGSIFFCGGIPDEIILHNRLPLANRPDETAADGESQQACGSGTKYFRDSGAAGEDDKGQRSRHFKQAGIGADRYFAGENRLPPELLAPAGGEFRQAVWKNSLKSLTRRLSPYGELQNEWRRMNRKTMSAQAVGETVGAQSDSVIIPCHRVVVGRAAATGYAGGIEKNGGCLRMKVWM